MSSILWHKTSRQLFFVLKVFLWAATFVGFCVSPILVGTYWYMARFFHLFPTYATSMKKPRENGGVHIFAGKPSASQRNPS